MLGQLDEQVAESIGDVDVGEGAKDAILNPPGDQETTPGGIAGETAAMPPGSSEPETSTSSTTPAEPAP